MKFKQKYDPQELVKLYCAYGSTTEAAKHCEASYETIRRACKASGIKLDGRSRNGKYGGHFVKVTTEDFINDCKKFTSREIAEKYGMRQTSVNQRARKIGIKPQPSTQSFNSNRDYSYADEWHTIPGGKEYVEKWTKGKFEFVAYKRGRYRIRCAICGQIIERAKSTIKQKNILCDCVKADKVFRRERIKHQKAEAWAAKRVKEKSKIKVCAVCGEEFHSESPNAKYCSDKCKRRNKPSSYKTRCRKYGVQYDSDVTLSKILERDNGICQICGEPISFMSNEWTGTFGPLYPTIDHVVPLSKGGTYTWNNVQLAHAICNSIKRDKIKEAVECHH